MNIKHEDIPTPAPLFQGRTLLVVTQHKKEFVMAPLLESSLGVRCTVADSFDTDKLGTFTGEVDRVADPPTTARSKCLQAMQLYQCDLAVASEGSFGPHPTLFFVPADEEFVCLIDRKNSLEIQARELSTETNFNYREITDMDQLHDFAQLIQFPEHGLIVRKSREDVTEIIKGITTWPQLTTTVDSFLTKYGSAYVETDMRALFNPTRMKVIGQATQKLIDRILSCCPQCQTPGFGIAHAKPGLPCGQCGFPTRAILSYWYQCERCAFGREVMYPHQISTENPAHCDLCNP